MGGKLNCKLTQRSGNFPVGVPFNTCQYAALMILFAYDLGIKPGLLTHVIADAHIYENQMIGVKKWFEQYDDLIAIQNDDVSTLHPDIYFSRPKFEYIGKEKSFFDMKLENMILSDYKSMSKIDFEIAV